MIDKLNESIDITPVGMKTQDGVNKVTKTLDNKQAWDSECANLLKDVRNVMERIGSHESVMMLARYGIDEDDATELVSNIFDSVVSRDIAIEDFFKSLSGR